MMGTLGFGPVTMRAFLMERAVHPRNKVASRLQKASEKLLLNARNSSCMPSFCHTMATPQKAVTVV